MFHLSTGYDVEHFALRLCLQAVRTGGSTDVLETRRIIFFQPQLSFACRLGFRRYDGCQTSVASCEDIERGGHVGMDLDRGQWHWQGIGILPLTSILDHPPSSN